jgi:NAD(P)-dependent dehydrogenase (short-subunit alcohol dehydrogenase family)
VAVATAFQSQVIVGADAGEHGDLFAAQPRYPAHTAGGDAGLLGRDQFPPRLHNAGVLETGLDGPAALRSFDVNAVGIVRVTEAALPLLRKSANPTVVTVSSSAASFWAVTDPSRPEFGLPLALYSASKAAATMLTVQYAKSQPGIKFNALEPGTTATDMTAAFGIGRPVEESARFVVRLATLGADGPTGTFQDENGDLRW